MAETCDLLCLDLPKAEAIRAEQLERKVAERAASAAQALGDPTRLSIAAALSQTDELCGCDIAWIKCKSKAAAKDLEHDLKAEYLPPLTKR